MPYIDFNEVKARVSIEEVVSRLSLKTTKSGHQLRAACPSCKQGGDRAIAITPSKGLFYCFAAQAGGDQIALAAHVREVGPKEAAEWLGGTSTRTVQDTVASTGTVRKDQATGGFPPLEYLEHAHEAVEALGFDPEVALALGAGYAGRGILRGTVAIPIRLPNGVLAGYIGVTDCKLPSKWHGLPETNVIPLKKGVA